MLLATAQVRVETVNGCSRLINAICDTGAQANLITMRCADQLGLTRKPIKGNIRGLTGFGVHAKGQTTVSLHNRFDEQRVCKLDLIIVKEIMPRHPAATIETGIDNKIKPRLANKDFDKPSEIEMLLGADIWAKIIKADVQRTDDGLTIQDSALGWLVFGATNTTRHTTFPREIQLNIHEQDELIQLMRKLCETEDPYEKREWTKAEQWCEDNFIKTVTKRDRHYCVTIPIDPQSEGLGDSRNAALKRFYSLERKLGKNPVLREKYIDFMREYEDLGHMKQTDKPVDMSKPYYYIPHHSITKKFRVVFDASATTTNGLSFNNIQFAGPKVQDDLHTIILRFRLGRYGINADIRKMFRQIKIEEGQWDMQRIFWRERSDHPLKEYQLTVVTYGMKSSSFNSTRALKQCGLDHAQEFPETSKVIQQHFYVDDLLTLQRRSPEITKGHYSRIGKRRI